MEKRKTCGLPVWWETRNIASPMRQAAAAMNYEPSTMDY